MPRKCIPQDELVRRHANLQQRAPDNRRRRLRKTIRTNMLGLLVRRGLMLGNNVGSRRCLPSSMRSEVIGIPLK